MEQMTAEQAISLLGNIAGWDIDNGERGNNKRVAIKLAIDALEKQVPKKPISNKRGYYDCPNCSCNLEVVLDEVSDIDFCFICGQAIDWTE